ncbi:MAG: tetratricopeptide repeat protein [Flavobacteriales bacterium]
MKRIGILLVVIVSVTVGCSNGDQPTLDGKLAPQSAESRRTEIMEKEKQIGNPDIGNSLGRAKAKELVTLYRNYISVNPKDSITADYLFKAADLSVGLGEYQAALNLLDRLINEFPKFDRAPEMMLFKGFICENYMNNHAMAVKSYQALIDRYPNHRLAADAKSAIENLTLSEEELLEKFKAMNLDKKES